MEERSGATPQTLATALTWRAHGRRCTYVDEQGRRCSERHWLEFHHHFPYAMGGDHSLENLSLKCSSHNRYLAERDYGREAVRKHSRVRARPRQASFVLPG